MKKQAMLLLMMMYFCMIFSQTPTYEFITEPIDLGVNYYDYMPGSYYGLPLQVEENGDVFIAYHRKELAASTREVVCTYIDETGIIETYVIGVDDISEGYAAIDLDPMCGHPFVSWHGEYCSISDDKEIACTYDNSCLGVPGNWRQPFIVICENTPTPNGIEDEFIWPQINIGPSPYHGKRRVYIVSKNKTNCASNGNPSENILIAYADYDSYDLANQSLLDWTYRSIPILDEWHNADPEYVRPFQSCAVSDDGMIVFMGYTNAEDATSEMDGLLYVLINDNFGEGEFEFHFIDAKYDVPEPDPGSPIDVYFAPYLCTHFNSMFHDNNSILSFLGNMNMLIYPNSWYPDLCMMYPKIYTFDLTTNEFSFYDLYIEGANPSDDEPMIPWDLDEDGIVDSLDPNGYATWVDGWPIYHPDNGFHENNFKITKNEENGWLVAVWNDGLNARLAEEGEPGYEDWLETPEIAICISADNGETWSQPVMLNANDTPQLVDMIPCYVYPGDKIEDLGDNHGKLHLFFLDDYSWGSSLYGNGQSIGGMQKYCSLDIDFEPFTDSPEIVVPIAQIQLTNYPNPFNPSTTISFNIITEITENTEILIYNLKGQKVKVLSPNLCHPEFIEGRGEVKVTWNGTDQHNKPVSSGVYFAKLKAGNQTATRKMLLMK